MNPVQKLTLEIKNLTGTIQSAGVAATNVATTLRTILDFGERMQQTGVAPEDLMEMLRTLMAMGAVVEKFGIAMENLQKGFQNASDQ